MTSVTPPLISGNANWEYYKYLVGQHVENSYGKIMSQHHRHLVKCMATGETYDPPRPYIHEMLKRVAQEVIAVVSAAQNAYRSA